MSRPVPTLSEPSSPPSGQDVASPPPRGGGLLVLAALVAGLAAGYLAGAYGSPSVPRAALEPPEPPPEVAAPRSAPPPAEEPLAERIPQTADARLLAVAADPDLELIVWPGAQIHPRRRPLPFPAGYTTVSFDPTGSSMAAVTASAWDASLYVGTLDFPFGPAFVGATSSVWHPLTGGRLAWTGSPQGSEDLHLLYRGRVRPGPSRLEMEEVAEIAAEERLVAWGPWGYALSDRATCPSLRVLGAGGEEQATGRLRLWDASGRGDLLVTPCDLPGTIAITDPSLERIRALPSDEGAALVGARWSPTGNRLALVVRADSRTRLQVLDRDGRVREEVEIPLPFTVEWPQPDAIVMAARGGQVVVVDPEEGSVHQVMVEGRLLVAALR